ncbi:MAG: spermidine/putrescine ABC transporter permease [Chloroflexota bacterium]|nr:MAG: spermidine/putrescine ABC transporter permease [Chloroflexota bacterium]
MASITRRRPGPKHNGFMLALPAILWLTLFFLLPVVIVFVVSFLSRGRGGVGELPFTLANYERVWDVFRPIIVDSVWVAFITTVICLLVGYPLAFFISTRKDPRMRSFALFMIILPFWTNFLVRTYALQTILGREGIVNTVLLNLRLLSEPAQLLNTPEAVILGLVYGYLPFMVLPIYASVERFDFRYVEAAHDLGANDIRAFLRVVLPLTLPGVIAGFILVFIPTIGAFVTPDLLGGTRGIMIGNLIQQQFRGSGNQPLGSALSVVLMAMVMIALLVYIRFGEKER